MLNLHPELFKFSLINSQMKIIKIIKIIRIIRIIRIISAFSSRHTTNRFALHISTQRNVCSSSSIKQLWLLWLPWTRHRILTRQHWPRHRHRHRRCLRFHAEPFPCRLACRLKATNSSHFSPFLHFSISSTLSLSLSSNSNL